MDRLNAEEFAQFKKEYYEDAGQAVPVEFQNPSQYRDKDNDWYGALLRTAPIQSYNLSLTSNKERVNTAVVAGYFQQDGVVLNNTYKRYSVRLNTDYSVSDKVKIGFNPVSYTHLDVYKRQAIWGKPPKSNVSKAPAKSCKRTLI